VNIGDIDNHHDETLLPVRYAEFRSLLRRSDKIVSRIRKSHRLRA
jgi:hypothetical protein